MNSTNNFSGKKSNFKGKEPIWQDAEQLVKRYKLDDKEIGKIVSKQIDEYNLDLDFNILSPIVEAISHMGIKSGLEIFYNENIKKIVRRSILLKYLKEKSLPLYSRKELVDILNDFIPHLENNKNSLITTGLIKSYFNKSWWLDSNLSPLYYTKLPADVSRFENKDGKINYTYRWGRKDIQSTKIPTPGVKFAGIRRGFWRDFDGNLFNEDEKPVKICTYNEADFIKNLVPQNAEKLSSKRVVIFELKIMILKELVSTINSNDEKNIWENCLSHFQKKLSGEDAEFLFKMDKWYTGWDFLTGENKFLADGSLIPGGLTNLLGIIGHVVKEIKIGTFHLTRTYFNPYVKLNTIGQPRLNLDNYYQSLKLYNKKDIDKILDKFDSLLDKENNFGQEFRIKCLNSLKENLKTKISFDITWKNKIELEKYFTSYVPFVETNYNITGDLPKLQHFYLGEDRLINSQQKNKDIEKHKSKAEIMADWYIRYLKENPDVKPTQSGLAKFSKISQPQWSRAFNDDDTLNLIKEQLKREAKKSENIFHESQYIDDRISKVKRKRELSYNKSIKTDAQDEIKFSDKLTESKNMQDIEDRIINKLAIKGEIEKMDMETVTDLLRSQFNYGEEELESYPTLKTRKKLLISLIES